MISASFGLVVMLKQTEQLFDSATVLHLSGKINHRMAYF